MSKLELTFDAVYYHVTDIEKSIAFYRDVLGFHLASRDYVARFDLGGVLFELVPNPPDNALPGTGNARLSLGVTDIRQAMRDGFSTSGSLGLGLPGVRRLMDEFEIASQPGKGTRVAVKKWRQ